MNYMVLGYAFKAGLDAVTEEDTRKLTHVNIAFGLIKDGLLDMSGLPNMDFVKRYRGWNPDMKLVLFFHHGHDGSRPPGLRGLLSGSGGAVRSGRHRH